MIEFQMATGIMSIKEFVDMLAQSFFGGNTAIAGILLYMVAMAIVFLLFARNNVMIAMLLSLPMTLAFSLLGILPTQLTLLLVVVAIIALANEYYRSQVSG